MSALNVSPDILWAFVAGFMATALVALWLTKSRASFERIVFTLGVSIAGGVIAGGLLTVIALAIDDWSACRLSAVVSLFYGYPLFSMPGNPANGNIYGPIGSWVYLPAAAVAFLSSSPTAGLLAGQFQAFVFVWIPIVLLFMRRPLGGDRRLLLVLSLCALGLIVGTAPLRYVSFSVHVDAPALCFAALAIWFSARAVSGGWRESVASGIFVGLALMSKQTMLPIGGVCLVLLIFCGWRVLWLSSLGFASAILTTLAVVAASGAADGMVSMYLILLASPLMAMTLLESAQILAPNLLIQIAVMACIAAAVGIQVSGLSSMLARLHQDASFRFVFGLFFAAAGYALVGIYTGARHAADSNHYAPAMYFLLLAIIGLGLNPERSTSSFFPKNLLLVAAAWIAVSPVLFFIPRFPGWYLYQNNFLEHAYQYSKLHPGEAYFPWQPLSVLLAEGRLYHLGEQLYYEDLSGLPLREPAQYLAHLPQEAKFIAIRPFGAPASVLPMLFPDARPGAEVEGLPGWQVHRFSGDRLQVTLPR